MYIILSELSLEALEGPLNIVAEKTPLAVVMLFVVGILAWSFKFSVKKLTENFDKSREDIKQNAEKSIELMKEYLDKKK